MKIFSSKKRVAAIGVVTAATLVGGGMAYAYWTSTGTGSGQATTATAAATVLVSQTNVAGLFPGDAPKPLPLSVSASGQSAYVAGIKAFVTTNQGGCTAADYLVNGSAVGGTALTATPLIWSAVNVQPGTPVLDSVNTIEFNDLPTTNQNACQGATVTITYATS